jgi:hypothetical protein
MTMWLYQLSEKEWSTRLFLAEIWENQHWHWSFNTKRGEGEPQRGDTVLFFYAPKDCDAPGIYGWGVIDRWEPHTIYFTPTAPTNHLKMDPWWDDKEVKEIVDEIRENMPRATLFRIQDEIVPKIRKGIKKWLSA